jgi:hypothetical protein
MVEEAFNLDAAGMSVDTPASFLVSFADQGGLRVAQRYFGRRARATGGAFIM